MLQYLIIQLNPVTSSEINEQTYTGLTVGIRERRIDGTARANLRHILLPATIMSNRESRALHEHYETV